VENSIAALSWGVRQIKCSINGLGARKGNADLGEVVNAIINHPNYSVDVEKSLIYRASELVSEITGIHNHFVS
jgi:2-isopropylmalate synthase